MILLTFFTVLCLINCFLPANGKVSVVTIQKCTRSLDVQEQQKLFSTERFENITREISDAYRIQGGWRMWRTDKRFRRFAIVVQNTNQSYYLTVVNGRFSLKLSTQPETHSNENDSTVFRLTRSQLDSDVKLKHELNGLYIGKNFILTNIKENACVKITKRRTIR